MTRNGWVSIDKKFSVECVEHGIIDERRSYAEARKVAQDHRREAHDGEGFTIGGTWHENTTRDEQERAR